MLTTPEELVCIATSASDKVLALDRKPGPGANLLRDAGLSQSAALFQLRIRVNLPSPPLPLPPCPSLPFPFLGPLKTSGGLAERCKLPDQSHFATSYARKTHLAAALHLWSALQ